MIKALRTKIYFKNLHNMNPKLPPHPKKSAFTILENLIFICLIIITIVGIYFSKQMIKANDVKSLIMQIKKYDTAIASFAEKYHALPGDVKGTVNFGITENNTDGNNDNIVTDHAGKIISANGEITNFWMHLSKTKMLNENYDGKKNAEAKIASTFPISKIGDKIGIVAYGDEGKIFYQIGFKFSNDTHLFMSDKSLKTDEAYWFDKKLDDGNPKKGKIIAVGKKSLNIAENNECIKFLEYDQTTADPVCQLRIEVR